MFNMISFQKYIAKQILHKQLRFKCSCAISFDIIGRVVDVNIHNNEFLYTVIEKTTNRMVTIGSNHPGLEVEEV